MAKRKRGSLPLRKHSSIFNNLRGHEFDEEIPTELTRSFTPSTSYDDSLANAESVEMSSQSSRGVQQPPVENVNLKCLWDKCRSTWNTHQAYNEHIKAHVESQEDHACMWSNCKSAGTPHRKKAWLRRHMELHTGVKAHPCPISGCHQSFNLAGDLEGHLQSHFTATERIKRRQVAAQQPSETTMVQCPPVHSIFSTNDMKRFEQVLSQTTKRKKITTGLPRTLNGIIMSQRANACTGGLENFVELTHQSSTDRHWLPADARDSIGDLVRVNIADLCKEAKDRVLGTLMETP